MKTCPRFPDKAPKPGVYHDVPAEEYHRWAAVSSSMVKAMAGGPRVCRHFLDKSDGLPTAAMRFGTAVHAALFEPEKFMAATEIDGLAAGAKPETFETYAKAHGPLILAEGWRQQIRDICAAVDANPAAADLVDGGRAEVSVVWDETVEGRVVRCKARLDYYKPKDGVLVELKTTDHRFLDERSFASHAWRMNYHVQIGHETSACDYAYNGEPETWILAVSSSEPYDAVPYSPDVDWICAGASRRYVLLSQIAECLETNEWPGLAGPAGVRTLSPPSWAREGVEA